MRSVTLRRRMTTCVFNASLVVSLFSFALLAQANFGRILGTVTDQTGAVLPGAPISIIDKDRGLARSLTTDEAGQYNAPTLIPGTYTVRVEFPGFKTLDRQNVVVEVGKEILVDLTIEPGQQSETVTVNEAIPLVDTTGATLGRHTPQRGHRGYAVEWPQLSKSVESAAGRRGPTGRRTVDPKHQQHSSR